MSSLNQYMSEKEAFVFVSALVHVANIDGIRESEQTLIDQFIQDLGYGDKKEKMLTYPFSLEEAVTVLKTPHARTLLIKSCVLMIKQDHEVSHEEREALEFLRRAFVPQEDLNALLNSVHPAELSQQ